MRRFIWFALSFMVAIIALAPMAFTADVVETVPAPSMVMQQFQWIAANWAAIIGALLAVVGGLSVIAKLTPTPKDDAALAKIVKVLDFLAMNKQR